MNKIITQGFNLSPSTTQYIIGQGYATLSHAQNTPIGVIVINLFQTDMGKITFEVNLQGPLSWQA